MNGTPYTQSSTVDYIKNTNSEAIIDSVTVNDCIYGVPFTTNTWYMFYDKSVYGEDDIKSLDTMLEKGKVSFPLTNSWYIGAFYVGNGCTLFGEDGKDEEAGIDFGYNLMSAAASKAYNSSVHASKKNKVNIQACAIASVIQIAVYKAKSMKKKQNNRRKKGWIDLEGIRKRRTYN